MSFKSDDFFKQLAEMVPKNPKLTQEMKAVFVYNVKSGDQSKIWTIDLKNGNGSCYEGKPKTGAEDVTMTIADSDLMDMINKKANPQNLFMQKKLQFKGNLGLAMKFEKVLKAADPKAKL